MPNPETVKKSQTFQLDKVIYNHNNFSIGVGCLMDNNWVLAMRWNGIGDQTGFPYAGKNPLWLTLPPELTISTLTSLLNSDIIKKEEHKQILNYLTDFKKNNLKKI
jgi:hypothetical protein